MAAPRCAAWPIARSSSRAYCIIGAMETGGASRSEMSADHDASRMTASCRRRIAPSRRAVVVRRRRQIGDSIVGRAHHGIAVSRDALGNHEA